MIFRIIERGGRGFSQGRLYRAAKDGDIEGAVERVAVFLVPKIQQAMAIR
jgi:hypothetical protein